VRQSSLVAANGQREAFAQIFAKLKIDWRASAKSRQQIEDAMALLEIPRNRSAGSSPNICGLLLQHARYCNTFFQAF
jgi:hypothetical protein